MGLSEREGRKRQVRESEMDEERIEKWRGRGEI